MNGAIVREVWGSRSVKWEAVDAVGSAGGILLLWDSHSVSIIGKWKSNFFVSVLLEDEFNNSKWIVTSVYGPQSCQSRIDFWKEL